MRAELLQLTHRLEVLSGLIARGDLEDSFLAAPALLPPAVHERFVSLKSAVDRTELRRHRYSAAIVELYGAFEVYVDAIIEQYLISLTDIFGRYSDLPKEILESHRRKSIEGLNDEVWMARRNLDASDLVENLYLCESDQPGYRLNVASYSRHTSNYRRKAVNVALATIGLPDLEQRLLLTDSYLELQEALDGAAAGLSIDGYLEDLSSRRNEVAHGSPSELLSTGLLHEYSDVVLGFSSAIFEAMRAELCRLLASTSGIQMTTVATVARKSVVLTELEDLTPGSKVETGDAIVMPYSGRGVASAKAGRILEMQTDDTPVSSVTAGPETRVGLSLSFRPHQQSKLFLCRVPPSLSWLVEPVPPLTAETDEHPL